jgi:hypothetical protein
MAVMWGRRPSWRLFHKHRLPSPFLDTTPNRKRRLKNTTYPLNFEQQRVKTNSTIFIVKSAAHYHSRAILSGDYKKKE